MKIAHLLTAIAVAAGTVATATVPAEAHPLDVIVVPNGAPCPANYNEVAQVGQTTICHHIRPPYFEIVLDGAPCDPDHTEYSVLETVRLCVEWDH